MQQALQFQTFSALLNSFCQTYPVQTLHFFMNQVSSIEDYAKDGCKEYFTKMHRVLITNTQNDSIGIRFKKNSMHLGKKFLGSFYRGKGTCLADGQGSAARFSERYPLLITETCCHTHFYDEFWWKTTLFGYFLSISG